MTSRAQAVFNDLDWYGRWCIYTWGTAFTTYEDLGDDVCAELRRLADAWAQDERKRHGTATSA